MHNGIKVSLGEVVWKVLRNPLAENLTLEQASEYCFEFFKLVGAPLSFVKKVSDPLELVNFKTYIPKDIVNINGVKWLQNECDEGVALRYATDTFHLTDSEKCEFVYIVNSDVLTCSKKSGFVLISYDTIETDENGYPLIPDNESFKKALEYYILFLTLEPLWMMGKIQDKVFQYIQQRKDWYIGQTDTSLKIQGPDHLESIMNTINRMIIVKSPHRNSYKNLGDVEYIKQNN